MPRIGITQRVEDLRNRNERRDCLDQEWARLLTEIQIVPLPVPNRCVDLAAWVEALAIDGFILSGGNDLAHLENAAAPAPERDATERRILELARATARPVLGVCRGLQMMVVDRGGKITPVSGHVAVRHGLVVSGAPPMPLSDREVVNSFHDYGVLPSGIGPEWMVAATATDGSVEAICHREFRQWAIMWHPERDPFDPRDRELINALFLEVR